MSRDNITFSDATFYKQKINSTAQLITNDLNDNKYTISDSILVIKSPSRTTTYQALNFVMFIFHVFCFVLTGREDLEAEFFCTSKSNNLTIAFDFQVAPFFYSLEKTKYTLTEGNVIELTCKILFGNEEDKVQFKWLLKGQVLQNWTDKYVIRNQDDQTFLHIQMVAMEDAGLYTCQAINLYGESSSSIRISIKSSLAPLW